MRQINNNMLETCENLTEEEKKYLILNLVLAGKGEGCKEVIEKSFNEKQSKYFSQILLGSIVNAMEKLNSKTDEILGDCKENYKKILNKFKVLVQELKLNNSLEISILYTYLMWNGYFSKDNKLFYQIEDRAVIQNSFSYDIMSGGAVCLNFSDMLKDVLNECGYSSSILLNKLRKEKDLKKDYIPIIQRNVVKNKFNINVLPLLLGPITKKMGNHAFNLIEENGQLYIYDPTNLLFLELKQQSEASVICGSGLFDIKPYWSYVVNDSSSRSALETLIFTNNFSSPYTRRDCIFTSENCICLCEQNENLFKDYHSDINDDILKIVDTVNYYKENKKKILKSIK